MAADRRASLFALAPVLVVVGVGPALAGWAVHVFARAGEPPSPADAPSTLVTDGPLAYTRNPIYLGPVLAAFGVAVLFVSLVVGLYAALLWVVCHLLTVYREEPELRAELGDAYGQYCEDVPRWL